LSTVDLAADVRPLFAGRIENADVLVSDSRMEMPLPFSLPRSDVPAPPAAPAAAARIVSVRSIALRDVALRSNNREIVVSADSSLTGSTLSVRRFSAVSGRTSLDASGVIELSPRIDARLQANANRLDVDELMALAHAFTADERDEGTGAAQAQPARIAASIAAAEGTVGSVQVKQFATELALDGDDVALNRLAFEMFGGRYEGSVSARLGMPLSATLRSKIVDLDVAALAAFGGVPDTVTGRLTGSGTFSGTGTDMTEVLRSARGNGTAVIADGSIHRLNLVRTVVLFFGRPAPDAGESTDRFDRMEVGFSLANRVFRADPFSLRSTDADIIGTGTLNVETERLDGRADLVLSEQLSAQAGTDLYRFTREGNRVVLPALIRGTLANPSLTIDAAAAAKRGIRNELERRMKDLLGGFR
jgi:hypothetical protein